MLSMMGAIASKGADRAAGHKRGIRMEIVASRYIQEHCLGKLVIIYQHATTNHPRMTFLHRRSIRLVFGVASIAFIQRSIGRRIDTVDLPHLMRLSAV